LHIPKFPYQPSVTVSVDNIEGCILNAALFFVLTRDEHYTDTFEAVSATLWLHRMDRRQLSQNF